MENVPWDVNVPKAEGETMRPSYSTTGIYPEKTIIQTDTCTPVPTAALFTTART